MPSFIDNLNKQKVAIYIRVSTQYQIDKDSLEVQRRELIAYAEMVLGITDYYIFEDAGFSAKDTKRPAFQMMMNRIRMGEFTHLLVWKIDRISRNLLDFAGMYNELKQVGVAFVSKNEQFDTSSAIGEAMLKIILVFAELERNMTSERVSAVMQSRANSGKWNGGHVPLGYDYDKETKTFLINTEQANIVRRIFDLYEQEQSLVYVSRYLNEKGIKTKRGKKFSTVTVHVILTNVFYVGDYRYNTRKTSNGHGYKDESEWIIYKDHHEPIIKDRERFERIQFILKRNQRNSPEVLNLDTPSKSVRKSSVHFFGNLLQCGECGEPMWSSKDTARANGYTPSRYSCRGHRNKAGRCTSKTVSDITIAPFMFNYIANLIRCNKSINSKTSVAAFEKKLLKGAPFDMVKNIEPEGLKETLRAINTAKENGEDNRYLPAIVLSENPKAKSELQLLTERKIKLETAEKRLYTLYLYEKSSMTEEEYIKEKTAITQDLNDCLAKINRLKEDNQFLMVSEDGFMEKASYFVLVQKLLEPGYVDHEKIAKSIDESIIKGFFRNIVKKIIVAEGNIIEIDFHNEVTHKFVYK